MQRAYAIQSQFTQNGPAPAGGAVPQTPNSNASSDPLNPGPNGWNTVRQGQVGDCYFLSSMVDVARTNPQAIRDMIKQNPDNTYTVSFHGHDPVTVDGNGIPNGVSADGKWAQVLEQAWEKTRPQPEKGGSPQDAIRALTGKSTSAYDLSEDTSALGGVRRFLGLEQSSSDLIRNGLKNNEALVADTGSKTSDGIVANHAYSVVGMDDKGNIELRNPWGSTPSTAPEPNSHQAGSDGTFWMSQADFDRHFTFLEYQNQR